MEKKSTRVAYGEALVKLGKVNKDVVVLEADLSKSTMTAYFKKEFIENRGGIHHRFQRGYKNVINESIRLNNEGKYSPLAIETSGHAAFKENYFLDDGAYMAARLLIQLVESREKGIEFTDVLNELSEPTEEIEIRIPIKDKDFRARGEKILENFREYAGKKEG
ncbi:hypothetical protein JCM16775_0143 [Leptotrichia hofstadii]|uniref:Alpha-D-phosphohexomutase alpha/beta/alpha domain-containing protein n=2 Tax=Leptotrichia hofstadii TaxID=157688 RepID=A0A510JDV1_9FUSO|nr:hypothetical protein [Leptotrichia hofstadii]BBM37468.1 hypothetical protein JCM16775_0143 [Leptotrichia hofstadii]